LSPLGVSSRAVGPRTDLEALSEPSTLPKVAGSPSRASSAKPHHASNEFLEERPYNSGTTLRLYQLYSTYKVYESYEATNQSEREASKIVVLDPNQLLKN
jgi:hypothetical protein